MTYLETLKHTLKKLTNTQKKRRLLTLLLVMSLLLILFKSSGSSAVSTTYRIAYDTYWEKINLMGKQRNVSAFSQDILDALGREERQRINLIPVSTSEALYQGLHNREFDGILTSLTPTMINQTTMTFSKPYFKLGSVLVTRTGPSLAGTNELSRKIVGVQANTPSVLELEKDPSIQIKLYDDILTALNDLDNHAIDGALFPALPAYVYTTTFYAGKLKIATTPLTEEGLRLVTLNTPAGKELVNSFNEGLHTIKKKEVYSQLLHKWGLVNTEDLNNINEKRSYKPSDEVNPSSV